MIYLIILKVLSLVGFVLFVPSLIAGAVIIIRGLKDPDYKKWDKFSKEHPNE